MSTTPQKRALSRYRKRLQQKGMARFEVLARESDRELIRWIARRLAADDADSAQIRAALRNAASAGLPRKGGILEVLRRSPLAGAGLDLSRPQPAPRKVEM